MPPRSRIATAPDWVIAELVKLAKKGISYKRIRAKLAELEFETSEAGISRFFSKEKQTRERVQAASLAAKALVSGIAEDKDGERLLGGLRHILGTIAYKTLSSRAAAGEEFEPKDLQWVAAAIKNLSQSSHLDLNTEAARREKFAAEADERLSEVAAKSGLSPQLAEQIRRDVLGLSR